MDQTTFEAEQSVDQSVVVKGSPQELYRIWRDLESLPGIFSHLQYVHVDSPTRSHWIADGPLGVDAVWNAEITEDVPGKRLAWRSLQDADIDHVGSVDFRAASEPGHTEIRVRLKYHAFGGRVGTAIAKLFGRDPDQEIADDLRAFRDRMAGGPARKPPAKVSVKAKKPVKKAPAGKR